MKKYFVLVAVAALIGLGAAWGLARHTPYVSGRVERDIHGVGPQLNRALAQESRFQETPSGYVAKPEPPDAPPGLKPAELQEWTAMEQRFTSGLRVTPTFPERYSSGVQVSSRGMTVKLVPLRSNAAVARIENGKLVYHEAYPSTDSLEVVGTDQSEEFLLLHDAQAPTRFDYDLATMDGVTKITLSDNAVHLKNALGQELQIAAPWLVESGGGLVKDGVHWELTYPSGQAQPHLALVVSAARALKYPVVIDPQFFATTSMNVARCQHTATLLNNGQVLVAGGLGTGGYLASAELFNPETATWTVTGSMTTARAQQTATLLPNGEVLVAGGYNGAYLASAELYNPATGTWTATGNMASARAEHTATLLQSGLLLVAGGGQASNVLAGCELYSPATGTWSTTGTLKLARDLHTATLLPNGQVLVAGGSVLVGHQTLPVSKNLYGGTAAAELYLPTTGTWISTGSLVTARQAHTATLLYTGQVLVAGGVGQNSGSYVTASELFNPANGTWGNTSSTMTYASSSPLFTYQQGSATLVPNGTLVVPGGTSTTGYGQIFSPSIQGWYEPYLFPPAAPAINGYQDTATLLANGQILVAGGQSNGVITAACAFYEESIGLTSAPALNTMRGFHTSTLLPNGHVLIAGGEDNQGNVLNSAELYFSAAQDFSLTRALGAARMNHTATLLPNGLILVAGGTGAGNVSLSSAELYNPSSQTWTPTGSLNLARTAHTATLLTDGEVLVSGGTDSTGNHLGSAELYNPATGLWRLTGILNTARSGHTATLLPNGQVLIAGGAGNGASWLASSELYDPSTGTWAATGSLNTGRQSFTATLLPNGQVLAACGLGSPSNTPLATSELYNPATGGWTVNGSAPYPQYGQSANLMLTGEVVLSGGISSEERGAIYDPTDGLWQYGIVINPVLGQTATLMPNGGVLVAGGLSTTGPENAPIVCYYFGVSQTQLSSIAAVDSTSELNLTGTNLTGTTEGASGSTSGSASNIPVVTLQSLVNEQVATVTLDPSQGFSATSFAGLPVTGFVPGYALLTVAVNGTPSVSQIVSYSEAAQSISGFPAMQTMSVSGSPDPLPASTSAGLPITYTVVSGPATVAGNVLTLSGPGTVVLMAYQPGNGVYGPVVASETIMVTGAPAVATDTPTLPQWALGALGVLLLTAAGRGVTARRAV